MPSWRVRTAIVVGCLAVALTGCVVAAWVRSRVAASDVLTVSRTVIGPGASRDDVVTLVSAGGVLGIDSWHRQDRVADLLAATGVSPATARQITDAWQRSQKAAPWHAAVTPRSYPGDDRFRQPLPPFGARAFGFANVVRGGERYAQMRLPYWAMTCGGVTAAVVAGWPGVAHPPRARRTVGGYCPACGYAMRGSRITCPECGNPVDA